MGADVGLEKENFDLYRDDELCEAQRSTSAKHSEGTA